MLDWQCHRTRPQETWSLKRNSCFFIFDFGNLIGMCVGIGQRETFKQKLNGFMTQQTREREYYLLLLLALGTGEVLKTTHSRVIFKCSSLLRLMHQRVEWEIKEYWTFVLHFQTSSTCLDLARIWRGKDERKLLVHGFEGCIWI